MNYDNLPANPRTAGSRHWPTPAESPKDCPPNCRYCGRAPFLGSSRLKWAHVDPKPMWFCSDYPRCDSYVSCHDGGTTAMGTLAGPRLRKLRQMAHAEFDPLWKQGGLVIGRSMAYLIGARVMGLDDFHVGNLEDFHIGHLDEDQCVQLLDSIEQIGDALSVHAAAILNRASQFDERDANSLHAVFWDCVEGSLAASVPLSEVAPHGDLAIRAAAAGCIAIEDSVPAMARLTAKGRAILTAPLPVS